MKTKEKLALEDIRTALRQADCERTRQGLSEEQIQALEQTCLTLRQAERTAITDTETGLVKGFDTASDEIRLQTKAIKELVTRMNKVPKVLDTTETVVRECVKVLKAIAQWVMVIILMWTAAGCASMTKAQISRVNSLASASDSVKAGPGAVFETLADVRQQRGLFYTATLSVPDNRIKELNAMAKAVESDAKMVSKAAVYQKVLGSYVSALKSLSSEDRWKRNRTELRGIGRNIDSLAINYNRMVDKEDRIETGLARQIGHTSGYLAQIYGKRRQHYLLSRILEEGDTIVETCCNHLVSMLKSDEMTSLIENEEQGLEDNYRAYLMSMQSAGRQPADDSDARYLELKRQLADAAALRKASITWLQSLRKAHAKLLDEMSTHRTYQEVSDAIFELSNESAAIAEYF